jgi:hypothetical protein
MKKTEDFNTRARLALLIEAAENVIDNFAAPKGESYLWDDLRASVVLARRDMKAAEL